MDPNRILHGFEKKNLCSLLEFTFSLEQWKLDLVSLEAENVKI